MFSQPAVTMVEENKNVKMALQLDLTWELTMTIVENKDQMSDKEQNIDLVAELLTNQKVRPGLLR